MIQELTGTLPKALGLLLRPLARFCISRSLKYQDFIAAAKIAFVSAAEEELKRTGTEISTSRLSVMTGLQRADIDRLVNAPPLEETPRSLVTRVIGQWVTHKKYRDAAGKPRRLTCEGRKSEFSQLVGSVSRELDSYAVLFELERLGLVERTKSGLKLVSSIYISSRDIESGLQMLAADVSALFRAVEENLFESPEVGNLHLHTRYDNIVVSALPEIRQWCLDEGSKYLRRVQQHLAQFDIDANPKLANEVGGGEVIVTTFAHTRTAGISMVDDTDK